ncbi:MAG: TonB-dependent receptor [Bacteroidota bacterium]
MNIKITAFLAAWITIACNFGYAQTGLKISGKITTADGRPLDGATVYLQRAADSVLVKSALANADGTYLLGNLKNGTYKVAVTMMGFARYKSEVINLNEKDITLPAIALQAKGTALKEVTVSSAKPFVEHQIDRTVVNVDALISNAGSTAMDVLEKAPGVIVDQSGGISLNGKGVKIFIDDKPTYLSGTDLENYLRSLSSSTIDQLELMTNPPAKYDASGNGGIINIRIKRSKAVGFNGNASLSYSQGKYGRTNNSLNFNYRNNKFNATGNLSLNTNSNYNDLTINRHFMNSAGAVTSNFLQNDFIRRTAQGYNAKIGVDYYASDKTTFGIGLTGLYNPTHRTTLSTSRFLNPQNQPDSTIIANNSDDALFDNGGLNFNYRHQYKKEQELTIDLDYLLYYSNSEQSFLNTSYQPNGAATGSDLLTGNLPAYVHIYSAKTDYTQSLTNGIKLAAGLKTSLTTTDNTADYYYTIHNATNPDYGKTNHFLYRENINSAYINANKDFKRFSIQTGLRLENTFSNGHQLGNAQKRDSSFKRNYTSLFPTIYLQYKLDSAGTQSIGLNYGRRIDRPYYQDLNPFQSPLDKFTYYVGNPFLKPSYSNNIDLSYTYKTITTEFSYGKTTDNVNETIEILNGIYYSRPGNLGYTEYKTISIDAGFDPAKWLNIHVNSRVQNIHTVSSFYTGDLNTAGSYIFARGVLQFKTGKDWVMQASGGGQSRVTNAQFVAGARYRLDLAISKKLSTATTVKLVGNDVLYTFINSGDINNLANTKADYRNLNDSRYVVLSLSYRFGKAISNQRKHDANGADSEQSRVKN